MTLMAYHKVYDHSYCIRYTLFISSGFNLWIYGKYYNLNCALIDKLYHSELVITGCIKIQVFSAARQPCYVIIRVQFAFMNMKYDMSIGRQVQHKRSSPEAFVFLKIGEFGGNLTEDLVHLIDNGNTIRRYNEVTATFIDLFTSQEATEGNFLIQMHLNLTAQQDIIVSSYNSTFIGYYSEGTFRLLAPCKSCKEKLYTLNLEFYKQNITRFYTTEAYLLLYTSNDCDGTQGNVTIFLRKMKAFSQHTSTGLRFFVFKSEPVILTILQESNVILNFDYSNNNNYKCDIHLDFTTQMMPRYDGKNSNCQTIEIQVRFQLTFNS